MPMLKYVCIFRETPKPRRKSGKVKEEKEKKEIKVEVEVEVKEEENEIREDEEPPRKWVGSYFWKWGLADFQVTVGKKGRSGRKDVDLYILLSQAADSLIGKTSLKSLKSFIHSST